MLFSLIQVDNHPAVENLRIVRGNCNVSDELRC